MELNSSIAISRKTRDLLKRIGHKGDTYDSLILKLIDTSNLQFYSKGRTGLNGVKREIRDRIGVEETHE